MRQVSEIAGLRSQVREWRSAGERIAFVPTMGDLHPGHLSLVSAATELAERVVVSVFVNPTQFGPGEDFESYPQTLDEDVAALRDMACDLLFVPAVAAIYPGGAPGTTTVNVPGVSAGLCGALRPGHFQGVATVVTRLFNLVQPDLAVFGQKDFQQLLVIRKLVRDLAMPIEIVDVPTVREDDGLAMSSRNRYLDAGQRETAAMLYQTLQLVADQICRQPQDHKRICKQALKDLDKAGFDPDYLELCNAQDLGPVEPGADPLVLLVAATLGRARLIDNIQFSVNHDSA